LKSVDALPSIVSHELIHYQQSAPSPWRATTLLMGAIREGSADFVAELIAGRHINAVAHDYGMKNEETLWAEFKRDMNGTDLGTWFYKDPGNGHPNDLGYFIGYRISKAFYDKADDKHAALVRIFATSSGDAALSLLAQSGYMGCTAQTCAE